MKKKNIFVTGGSGFIGSTLIKNLINSGYKVNCLDIKKPDFPASKSFKFFKGSVNNKKLVCAGFDRCVYLFVKDGDEW